LNFYSEREQYLAMLFICNQSHRYSRGKRKGRREVVRMWVRDQE